MVMASNEEKEKIWEVVGKYSDFFKERDADVAIGIHGPHLFYVYDRKYRDFEIFRAFHTASELEMLILGALAENLECMNAVMADSLNLDFDRIDSEEDLYSYSGEFHLEKLRLQLEVMERECRNWSEMMQVTYRALRNLLPPE